MRNLAEWLSAGEMMARWKPRRVSFPTGRLVFSMKMRPKKAVPYMSNVQYMQVVPVDLPEYSTFTTVSCTAVRYITHEYMY